jgi:hypothetical protein
MGEDGTMPTRRAFLRLTGASAVGWYVATQFGWTQRAIAQILELTRLGGHPR